MDTFRLRFRLSGERFVQTLESDGRSSYITWHYISPTCLQRTLYHIQQHPQDETALSALSPHMRENLDHYLAQLPLQMRVNEKSALYKQILADSVEE